MQLPSTATLSSTPSQLSAAKDATLLGETISIGYPVEENSVASTTSSNAIKPLKITEVDLRDRTIAKLKQLVSSQEDHTDLPTLDFSAPQPVAPQSPTQPQQAPTRDRIVELNSNYQEYDAQRQLVTAEGDVLLRYDGAVLDADRLQVNLENLIGVGEGNVALTRGQQIIRGDRFTYNLVQDTGNVLNASGEVFIPTAGTDFTPIPTDVTAGGIAAQPLSDRITANQPLQQVTSPGGINIGTGSVAPPQPGGEIRRLRVEADTIDFYPEGWQATNVRITNDPFSPPELELRADTMTLVRETPTRDRIRTTGQRIVFDQGFSIPIPRNEQVIDSRQRQVTPGLVNLGYDSEDRGGLFVERSFNVIDTEAVRVSVTPQVFVQQAITESGGNIFSGDLFGVRGSLDAILGPQTTLTGLAVLPGLTDIGENLRASLRLRTPVNFLERQHGLNLEYSYRDRLYNGSLGYQTVRSSIGGIVTSPVIPLGDTGFNLSYQAGAQYITADSDRIDLLEPIRDHNRVSLGRLQGSAALSRGFLLWQGNPLPATANEGLRYTPAPVVPYVQLYAGVRGDASFYTSGDQQTLLTGTIGIQGQFGNFSRPYLDYTGFNLAYSQGLLGGSSPFLFDRAADTRILSAGITQQIYGPFRFGVQTSINVDTGQDLSTDYTLEYSRRTYGIVLRYNPTLELGSLTLRISDFNWVGGTDPFSGDVRSPF
jgi:lipopolysaccharide export system protein LptA